MSTFQIPEPRQVSDYIWAISQPLPPDHPDYINTYVIQDKVGDIHLIDPGWNNEANWDSLKANLKSLGWKSSDICSVTVTHQHKDHIGLAQTIKSESGCPIAIHRAEQEDLRQDTSKIAHALRQHNLEQWGVPATHFESLLAEVATQVPNIPQRFEADVLLEDGDFLLILGRNLRVHHTPGHTPGHICIEDLDAKKLFTGDHILGGFNPGVGLGRLWHPRAMIEYLDSLRRFTNHIGVSGLPGHGATIADLAGRARQILAHHENRVHAIGKRKAIWEDETTWELAQSLKWSTSWVDMSPTTLRMILAQTAMYSYTSDRSGIHFEHDFSSI